MFEQFAADAREAVTSALSEATLRGDRRIGTEHLLLGVLHEPSSVQALGTDLETARAALDALDRSALAAVGVDIQGIERPPIPASRKRTPFTSGARAVLPRALAETRKTRQPAHHTRAPPAGPARLRAAGSCCRTHGTARHRPRRCPGTHSGGRLRRGAPCRAGPSVAGLTRLRGRPGRARP